MIKNLLYKLIKMIKMKLAKIKTNSNSMKIELNEINIYDKEEIFENCTVQVLTNTVTGETSIGWWKNNQ